MRTDNNKQYLTQNTKQNKKTTKHQHLGGGATAASTIIKPFEKES